MSDDDATPPAPTGGGGCPFCGVLQRVGLSPRSVDAAKAGAAGVCPFFGAKNSEDASMPSTMPGSPPSTTSATGCPLGFGRSKPGGPPLSRLHCPRCKSLFHDCVLLNCGHRFCGSCSGEGARDCLACGADISSRMRDGESQRLADAALEDAVQADKEGAAQAWLRAAMSSAAGGNHAAALARSERAEAALEVELKRNTSSSSAAVAAAAAAAAAARRAAVSGVIGDSHRSLGDLKSAAERYEGAVAVLEKALADSSPPSGEGEDSAAAASASDSASPSRRELTRALTVTLNKLGDLLYSLASAKEARPLYARALSERLSTAGVSEEQAREASSSSSSSSSPSSLAIPPASEDDAERASDLVDAGLSAAKVADADAAAAAAGKGTEAAAAAEAAEKGLRLAAALLAAGAAGAATAEGPVAARAERLRVFLEGNRG